MSNFFCNFTDECGILYASIGGDIDAKTGRTLLNKAEDIEYLPPCCVSVVRISLSSRGTGARARHRPVVSQKDLTFLARYAIL